MGRPIFTLHVPIPNGNLEFKSDGFGQSGAGVPDGYRSSTQLGTDLIGAKAVGQWTTLRRGDTNYPYAPPHASRGRAFTVGVKNTATATTSRYLESPASLPGYCWLTEAQDPFATTNDFWYVRLRLWWRGLGLAPPIGSTWKFEIIAYTNANESGSSVVGTITLDPTTDWSGAAWVQKLSSPVKLTASTHHVRVRFTQSAGPTAVGTSYGSFSDLSVETLGPVDAVSLVSGTETLNPTYAEEGVGGTFYQMSKSHNWSGFAVTPMRMSKPRRLPSGGLRMADPSGGTMRRKFTIPVAMLPFKDQQKLYRLWLANGGLPQELASYYGTPMPILFSPQAPDDMGFYSVSFDGDEFPLKPWRAANTYQPATEAAQFYEGQIVLVEN